MSIKKSSLEQKWYYRIAKVFFLTLPFLVILAMFLMGYIDISAVSQNNISDLLQKNIASLIYLAIGLTAYYLILKFIWGAFLYIVFGGFEDDTKKKGSETAQFVNSSIQTKQVSHQLPPQPAPIQNNGNGFFILFLIFLALFIYFLAQSSTLTSTSPSTSQRTSPHAYCNPGNTYNYSSRTCCPNSTPEYYDGTYGISGPGCYATCPYIGACGTRFTRY